MKIPFPILTFLSVLLCSCSQSESLISEPQAKTVCLQFIWKSGYTNRPALVATRVQGRFCYYRFMDNGVLVPSTVRVDLQTGTAELKRY